MFDREKLKLVIFCGLNRFVSMLIKPQVPKTLNLQDLTVHKVTLTYRPHRAVINVSGNRCESDCGSRGHKFDPGQVPYFRGD